MKNFLLFLVLFLFSTNLSAQQRTITGTVTESNGDPIIGASVLVKGTTQGTTTNIDGKYTINIPTSAKVLVFRSVGKETKEIPVTSNVLNIVLNDNQETLEEVVVIGYGTVKRKDLTGSVASVDEKALKDIPVATVAEALTGKLPGVQVTTTEGSPDAEIKIRVRGGGSITQNNSPLYVVDGFIKDDIKDIAPTDIQSIDVLKDAATSAIYGSRGANGVIIITTKSAEQGKLSVSYNGYVGFKKVSKLLDVLNPYQFAKKNYERALWGNDKVESEYENYFGSFNDIDLYNYMNGTNWQEKTFGNTGVTNNHTISLNGGNKVFSYNASYSYLYDKAIMYMSNFNRNNLSLKLKYTPIKWLKLDLSTRYTHTVINGAGANDQTGTEKSTTDSRVKNAVIYTPIPLKNLVSQDDDAEATASLYSPLVATQDNNRYQKNNDFSINTGISVDIIKNLSVSTTVSLRKINKNDNRFFGLTSYFVTNGGALKRDNAYAPAVLMREPNQTDFQNTNLINYRKENLFNGQNLSIVLGQENLISTSGYTSNDIQGLPQDYDSFTAWDKFSDGTLIEYKDFSYPDNRLFSYFGRMNYDIFDRYLFAFTFRTDGSSKFSNGNEWGYFPAASAGWRISEEPFMKATQNWLTNLKLRASYGSAGNNRIDDSAFKRVYSSSHSNYLSTSIFPNIFSAGNTLANPDLKWETTITRNLGLDFGLLKNRINGSVELYNNTTKDVLIKMSLGGVGYTDQWQNAATTQNRGIEFNVNAVLVQTKDLNINCGFNISINRNKVVNLGNLSNYTFNETWTSYSEASNSYMVSPGNPVGLIYGYVSDGMYKADDFTWNGTAWVMNSTKYSNAILVSDDGKTKVYKYADENGNVFVDNSSIDGLSWGPGAMKLKDLNEDGKIDLNDKKVIGNANPKHFGAFTLNATYKNFDAAINLNWVYGNDIYNASKIELTTMFYKYRNMLALTNNSYTQVDWATGERITNTSVLDNMNANAKIWASPTGRYATTSWAIEDGSFLRLNNITIGYTLPSKMTRKIHIQKLRIYAAGYNLYCFTNYSGYDPEVDTRRATPATPGVDYSAYPKSRSYNMGVNITF